MTNSIIQNKMADEGAVVSFSSELEITICWNCSGTYAMSAQYMARRRDDGFSWHCPYCKQGTSFRTSKVTKLEKELARQKNATKYQRQEKEMYLRQRDTLERSRNGMKGVLVREQNKLKRVRNGVCPCCNRSFVNLQRHMAGQHPKYKTEDMPK